MATSPRNAPQLELPPSRNVRQLELPTSTPPSPPLTRPKLGTATSAGRTVTSQRLPPPTLFQGPPSKNASHVSLLLPGETHKNDGAIDVPVPDGRSLLRPSRVPPATSFSSGSGHALRPPPTQADDFRAESLWAEMQKTLADVELSAMNPSHIFGDGHAKALEDLRTAQLGLAQAWAKNAQDEVEGLGEGREEEEGKLGVVGAMETGSSPAKARREGSGDPDGKGGAGSFANNKNLEEETERDIRLARKRREANDRYFNQVSRGVLDVVGRLDEVASAMRRVEKESREIWETDDGAEGELTGDGNGSETGESVLTDSPVEQKGKM